MAIAAIIRWRKEDWARVTIITSKDAFLRSASVDVHWGHWGRVVYLDADKHTFARESIRAMEELATTDIYAGTDDDALIYGPDFSIRGLRLMKEHPEYGIVCAHPTNEDFKSSVVQPEIVKSHAVGGPGFARKGILTDFPELSNAAYAGHMHKQCLDKGFDQGYFRDLAYLHMGSKYSVASPVHCNGY